MQPDALVPEGRAEESVLHDLINALLQENLLEMLDRAAVQTDPHALITSPDFALAEGEIYLHLPLGNGRAMLFRGRRSPFLQPYRLSRPPVLLTAATGAGLQWQALSPVEVMHTLAEHLPGTEALPNLAGFRQDLQDAVAQTALSLTAARPVAEAASASRPSLVDWERLAALRDRPFHPSARTKGGWDTAEYRAFSPEFGAAFGLHWLAVRRDFVQQSPAATGAEVAPALLDNAGQRELAASFAAAGINCADYLALPVHPWQMDHVLPALYANELASDICVPVARNLGRFVATSSVRSLAPAGGGALHLKLPIGIYSLGALRLLPPRYMHNGVRAQALLEHLIGVEPLLARQLHLCGEERWWAFTASGADPFSDKPGHLACLLRTYPAPLMEDPETTVIPMSALAVLTPEGETPAAARILRARHGDATGDRQVLDLFAEVCRRLTEVALLCFRYGVMPELHGQNVLLAVRAGRVEGVLLRDHDTLRVHLPWMERAGLPDPGYMVKPNTPNTLINPTPEELLMYFQTLGVQVNLFAIADALARAHAIEEAAFWQTIRDTLEDAIAAFAFPAPVRAVLERQLLRSETWPVKLVLTPLLRRQGTGGGSMPSGTGEIPNPLRYLPAGARRGARER